MRTTLTLDADVEALIRKEMHERRVTFKRVVNDALRRALRGTGPRAAFETPTFDLGTPRVDLDHALALAGAIDDDELSKRLALGR